MENRLHQFNELLVFGNILLHLIIKRQGLEQIIIFSVILITIHIFRIIARERGEKLYLIIWILQIILFWFYSQDLSLFFYCIIATGFTRFSLKQISIKYLIMSSILSLLFSLFSLEGFQREFYELPLIILSLILLAILMKLQYQPIRSRQNTVCYYQELIDGQYLFINICFFLSKWLHKETAFILNEELNIQHVFDSPPTPYFSHTQSQKNGIFEEQYFNQDNIEQQNNQFNFFFFFRPLQIHLKNILTKISHTNQILPIFYSFMGRNKMAHAIIEQYQHQICIVIFFKVLFIPNQNIVNNQEEKKQQQLLYDVCSSISHELSTSLNCILMLSQLQLENQNISTELRQQFIEPILMNSRQLELIINNLRDYNSILTSSFQSMISKFNILNEIFEIVEYFGQSINQKGIEVIYQIDIENPIIEGDKQRIRQIFYQIMSNAVRFSNKGKIEVSIIMDNSNLLLISVSDQGIGMRPEECQRLKDLLNNSCPQRVSINSIGCGLGLYISNLLVKQLTQNRQIEFDSIYQKGTRIQFSFTTSFQTNNLLTKKTSIIKILNNNSYMENCFDIQSKKVPKSQKYDPKVESLRSISQRTKIKKTSFLKVNTVLFNPLTNEGSSFLNIIDEDIHEDIEPPFFEAKMTSSIKKYQLESKCCKRILIVDDEYFNIFALEMVMKTMGGMCDTAFNGEEAIKLIIARSQLPCSQCNLANYLVIFIDISMPIKDGFQTVKEIKLMVQNKIIDPVVCIANTAFNDLQTKTRAYESGMDYYITKPIDVVFLKAHLGRLFCMDSDD